MNIRIFMLLSEKHFQIAGNIGDIGLVGDEKGFSCSESPYILEVANELNKSYTLAIKTTSGIDTILYQHREVEQLQNLIGMNQNKTAFYYSHFNTIKTIVKTNIESVQKFCKAKVVKK